MHPLPSSTSAVPPHRLQFCDECCVDHLHSHRNNISMQIAAEIRDDSSETNWMIVGYAKKGSNTLVLVDKGEDGLEE